MALTPPSGEPVADAPPPPHEGPAAWRWWQGIGALFSAFIGASAAGAVVFVAGSAIWGGEIDDARGGSYMLALLVQDLCFIGFALLFASLRGGRLQPWMFGLRRPSWGSAVGQLALAYAVLLAFSLAWSQLVDIDGSEVADDLGVTANTAAAIAGAFLVGVLAPVAEEFLFRGVVFPALRTSLGTYGAALASGLLFGLVHVGSSPIGAVVPLVLFGFLLCLLYVRTGSLVMCMLLHALNNSFAYGGLVDWTWQIPVMLVACIATILLLWRAVEAVFGRVPLHLSAV